MSQQLSEQEIIRRDKLKELQQIGIDPYPAALFPVSHYSANIKEQFSEETREQFSNVTVAGRIMSINDKGKVFFIKIQDSKGIIQLYVRKDDVCAGEDKTLFDEVIKHLIDLGDIIGVTGFVFITRTGEISIHAKSFTL